MIERRPFNKLGGADHGWLKAKHHFSFAEYNDPARMGWGSLRVWNDDEIAAGTGFPPHPHADMEIITYVRDGAITHEDSLGNKGRTQAGDVQVMSAGSGIRHAEANVERETTRLFQIWIIPDARGGVPSWGARPFPRDDRSGRFVTLASGMPGDADALPIRASARWLACTEAISARPLLPARRWTTNSARSGMPIWCRRRARSTSTACASTSAMAPQSSMRRISTLPRWTMRRSYWSTASDTTPCGGVE